MNSSGRIKTKCSTSCQFSGHLEIDLAIEVLDSLWTLCMILAMDGLPSLDRALGSTDNLHGIRLIDS